MAFFRGSGRGNHRPGAALATVIAATLLVTACSAETEVTEPTPRPTATDKRSPIPTAPVVAPPSASTPPPAVETDPSSSLILTPEGMNGLVIGQPIPGHMAEFDPLGCRTEANMGVFGEYGIDDPIWEAYLPTYPQIDWLKDGYVHRLYPYEPHHFDDGSLRWLRIRSTAIYTDRGVHIGSSEDEVRAVYPDAEYFEKASGLYRTYNVRGEAGMLTFEVSERDFETGAPFVVWTMYLGAPDAPLRSMGGGDGGGFCALTV